MACSALFILDLKGKVGSILCCEYIQNQISSSFLLRFNFLLHCFGSKIIVKFLTRCFCFLFYTLTLQIWSAMTWPLLSFSRPSVGGRLLLFIFSTIVFWPLRGVLRHQAPATIVFRSGDYLWISCVISLSHITICLKRCYNFLFDCYIFPLKAIKCAAMLHQTPIPTGHFMPSTAQTFQFPSLTHDFINQIENQQSFYYPYSFPPQQPSFDYFKLDDQAAGAASHFISDKSAIHPPLPPPPKLSKTFKSPEEENRSKARRLRNNKAAQASRQKRRIREEELKRQVEILEAEKKKLKSEIAELKEALAAEKDSKAKNLFRENSMRGNWMSWNFTFVIFKSYKINSISPYYSIFNTVWLFLSLFIFSIFWR